VVADLCCLFRRQSAVAQAATMDSSSVNVSSHELPSHWTMAMRGSSCLLGVGDSLCAIGSRMKPIPKLQFVASGWGNMSRLDECETCFNSFVERYQIAKQIPKVEIYTEYSVRGGKASRGRFESPLARFLPDESCNCEFEVLVPLGSVRACVLVLPGTADQTYAYRRHSIATPMLQHGVAVILPVPPYYGNRRPAGQWLHYISKVSDFLLQSSGLIVESMQLLDWAQDKFHGAFLGVTGVSWGGAMTCVVGFLAKRHSLALVPCLPSASAAVLVTGALNGEVAIASLARQGESIDAAKQVLLDTLNRTDVWETQRHAEALPGISGTKVVIQVSAAHDTFVPPVDGLKVFPLLGALDKEAELMWIPGGHVSAHAWARWLFPRPVLLAFDRLSSRLGHPPPARL